MCHLTALLPVAQGVAVYTALARHAETLRQLRHHAKCLPPEASRFGLGAYGLVRQPARQLLLRLGDADALSFRLCRVEVSARTEAVLNL